MRRMVEIDKLNDVMSFDHVIRVWSDGSVSEPTGVYSPEVSNNGEDVDPPWMLMSGYTEQSGYDGPCLHTSEFIGGGLAREILSQPGWYVAVVAEADRCSSDGCEECDPSSYVRSNGESVCPVDCDLCESDEPAGWVVAYVEADCPGHESVCGPIGNTVECDGSCVVFPKD